MTSLWSSSTELYVICSSRPSALTPDVITCRSREFMTSSTSTHFSPPLSSLSEDVIVAVCVDVMWSRRVTWPRVTSLVMEKWREDGVRMSTMRKDLGFVMNLGLRSASAAAAASGEELDDEEEDGWNWRILHKHRPTRWWWLWCRQTEVMLSVLWICSITTDRYIIKIQRCCINCLHSNVNIKK